MNAVLFDGSPSGDLMGDRVATELTEQLLLSGYNVRRVMLRDLDISDCSGCFGCWLKTPGQCMMADDNRLLSRFFMQSSLAIFMGPVTFGSHAPALKGMIDHLIANILPFFMTVAGETHHTKRYERYPDILTIGWLDHPEPEAEGVFRHLAYRNALNFHSGTAVAAVLHRRQPDDEVHKVLLGHLDDILNRRSMEAPSCPRPACVSRTSSTTARAVLLVGSPKMQKSNSAMMASYLSEQFATNGVHSDIFHIHKILHDPDLFGRMIDALGHSDLAVLLAPLYVDTLPAPMLAAMERIADARIEAVRRPGFAAVVNSGFPEPVHIENALASCAVFARSAGFAWLGGFPVGGGDGIIRRRPLEEAGRRGEPLRRALSLAASSLAAGGSVGEEPGRLLSRPSVPAWLYRMVATRLWHRMSRRYGTRGRLCERPVDIGSEAAS